MDKNKQVLTLKKLVGLLKATYDQVYIAREVLQNAGKLSVKLNSATPEIEFILPNLKSLDAYLAGAEQQCEALEKICLMMVFLSDDCTLGELRTKLEEVKKNPADFMKSLMDEVKKDADTFDESNPFNFSDIGGKSESKEPPKDDPGDDNEARDFSGPPSDEPTT